MRQITVADGCKVAIPEFFDRGERVLPCDHGRKWRFQATVEVETSYLVSEVVDPVEP